MVVHKLQVQESGQKEKPAIVFLHGVGASGRMWQSHMRTLQEYYCLANDLPGHGGSTHIEWSTMDVVVEYVSDLIKNLPHKKAHVVGLSLGGSVTIRLLSRHSEVIDHAVVDGAGIIPIQGVTSTS